jgi:hypothetical protein
VNNNKEIPFAVKRIFYLYDIPGGESRGAHSHKNAINFWSQPAVVLKFYWMTELQEDRFY